MKESEAIRVVSMLGAAFNRDLGEDTIVLWARGIMDEDVEDALEAVEVAARSGKFVPSLKEFQDYVRDCRITRHTHSQRPLPSHRGRYTLAQHLAETPEDREKVNGMERHEGRGEGDMNVFYDTLAGILKQEIGK
jgi:hypothetical protein